VSKRDGKKKSGEKIRLFFIPAANKPKVFSLALAFSIHNKPKPK
jgi:hypothetical protein